MNKGKRRIILVLLVGCAVLVGIIFLISLAFKDASRDNKIEKEGSAEIIIINNTQSLAEPLLEQQYYAVKQALSDYIAEKVDKKVEMASVVGSITIADNGNILFTVKTEKPSKSFDVVIDRNTDFDKLILKVPKDNYSKTLEIYTDK